VVKDRLPHAGSDRATAGDLDMFVRLREDQDYAVMLEAMGAFKSVMRQVYTLTADPHDNTTTTEVTVTNQEVNLETSPAYLARDLMQSLHSSLTGRLTYCELGHKARLHLPISQKEEPTVPGVDVDMYLSTCREPCNWQEAKCVIQRCVFFPQLVIESEPLT
jgi:hypothetical protein